MKKLLAGILTGIVIFTTGTAGVLAAGNGNHSGVCAAVTAASGVYCMEKKSCYIDSNNDNICDNSNDNICDNSANGGVRPHNGSGMRRGCRSGRR